LCLISIHFSSPSGDSAGEIGAEDATNRRRSRQASSISTSWPGEAQDLAARLDFTSWSDGDGTVNYGLDLPLGEIGTLEGTSVDRDSHYLSVLPTEHSVLESTRVSDDLATPSGSHPDPA